MADDEMTTEEFCRKWFGRSDCVSARYDYNSNLLVFLMRDNSVQTLAILTQTESDFIKMVNYCDRREWEKKHPIQVSVRNLKHSVSEFFADF